MKVKYGILVFPGLSHFPKDGFQYQFAPNERLLIQSIEETFGVSNDSHWKEWLGTIAWDEFSKGSVQIQCWIESKTVDVVGAENNEISSTLNRYISALALCDLVSPPSQRPMIITGQATLQDGKLTPEDIRTFSKGPKWIRQGYLFLDEYRQSAAWKATVTEPPFCYGDWLFKQWRDIFEKLQVIDKEFGAYFLLNLAVYSFQRALSERILDFSFPNLVRAVETLVTISAGQGGRSFFARRAQRFLPPKEKLFLKFDDPKIKKILKESYGLRSDAVHGKPFAWTLGSRRVEFLKAEVNYYVYLLETLARNTIRAALGDPDFRKVTKDRNELEAYWNSLDVPPPQKLCPACNQPERAP